MELSGQLHAPATLFLGKEPPVPIGQETNSQGSDVLNAPAKCVCYM